MTPTNKAKLGADILLKAAGILRNAKLAKGALARNRQGHSVPPSAKSAVSYCLMGALKYAAESTGDGLRVPDESWKAVTTITGTISPSIWNDKLHRRKGHVIKMLEKAAASLTPKDSPTPKKEQ